MRWGFRQRIRLSKGVMLNLGKKSVGVRIGPRNAGVTLGTAGSRVSATIPGTGVSIEQPLGRKSRKTATATPRVETTDTAPPKRRSIVSQVFYGLILGGILSSILFLFS